MACCLISAAAMDVMADPGDALQQCLQAEVVKPENRLLGVAELYDKCTPVDNTAPEVTDNPPEIEEAAVALTRFFRPYKDNYIALGRARTDDDTVPFSGEQLDAKFELGLTFNLFDEITNLDFLAPLGFGYSQRSWWNIGEESAPFAEHNYNPEIFWSFNQPRRPLRGQFPFIDIVGLEHQSNGLEGSGSRAWDRLYIQKEFHLLPQLSMEVKLWDVIGDEANNADITDYLGHGQVNLTFRPNDRTRIRVRLLKGDGVQKYSYQADISYRRPWVNSAFFISYYDGYGEALISYNRKIRSLRAGLYFPLEVLNR